MNNLQEILTRLESLRETDSNLRNYSIPGIWINSRNKEELVQPFECFSEIIAKIINSKKIKSKAKPITESIIYNMMPRYSTSFQHYQSEENIRPLKTEGTFLKSIILLPYLKSLGVDILYLLPITSVGKHNKKGDLGSVYAVRNPYNLDENLSEDILELSIETQFKAFVEAAHQLGIKIVVEFIFRTASIDSDLAFTHPEWFYWINEKFIDQYSSPEFSEEDLEVIKAKIENKDYSNLISPAESYKNIFTSTPRKVYKEGNKYIGILENGERCVIPGAFADWPPDDNQPIWSDVTYLKIFDDPNFNYIAYNTVRMYDNQLDISKKIQSELVEHITNVVPFYIKEYDIDGIMLDMGHALPEQVRKAIINKSKKIKKSFIFLEESFIPNIQSKNEKFDAVVGYLPFDLHNRHKIGLFINRLAENDIPIPCFATSENHNTPRVQSRIDDRKFSILIWALSSFLPKTIRFIHSGFELLASNPVNTGLGFSDDDILKNPADSLPLFSSSFLNWKDSIVADIININTVRNKLFSDSRIDTFSVFPLHPYHQSILAYILSNGEKQIFISANYSEYKENLSVYLPQNIKLFHNSLTSVIFEVHNNEMFLEYEPYEVKIGELK